MPVSATPPLTIVFPQPPITLFPSQLVCPSLASIHHHSCSHFGKLLNHPSLISSSSLPHRSSGAGLCDSGLSPALLPQHHVRRHWQRRHLRPGGGVARPGASSPEEAKRPAAQRRKGELVPPPPAPAAVPSGHFGAGPRPSRGSRPLPRLPDRSGPVQLNSSGTTSAVWDPLSLRTVHGLTSIILTSCSGCQVNRIMILTAV